MSMARSTPAQKPRGAARNKGGGDGARRVVAAPRGARQLERDAPAPLPVEDPPRLEPRRLVRGLTAQPAPVDHRRVGRATQVAQRLNLRLIGEPQRRVAALGLAVVLERRLELPRTPLQVAEVDPGRGVLRVERQRALVLRARLGLAPARGQHRAQVAVAAGARRGQHHRGAQRGFLAGGVGRRGAPGPQQRRGRRLGLCGAQRVGRRGRGRRGQHEQGDDGDDGADGQRASSAPSIGGRPRAGQSARAPVLVSRAAMTHRFTRYALALAVAAMGVVDLWSAFLSRPPDRLIALRHLVPTEVLDTSRSFTLLAGALLLVTAWGLRRGKRRAFVGALLLCAGSVPVNMLKPFDFEEASAATALMFLLGISGQAFQVESRALSFSALRSRALLLVLGLAVYAVGGCWLLEILYAHGPSLARAFQEAGYQLFGIGSPTAQVPPHHHVRDWYPGPIGLLSTTTALGLALAGLQPPAHRRRHPAEHAQVEALLRPYGGNPAPAFPP